MTVQANRADDHVVDWRPEQDFGAAFPAAPLRDLLTTTGSMTGALRARCDGDFALALLEQTRTPLAGYQSGVLGAGHGSVREVLMSCAGQPWVFAQSLFPAATVAAHPWLETLDDTPLGDQLFARADVRRSPLLFARLRPSTPLHRRSAALLGGARLPQLWARRSQIHIASHPLVINEVFLPALLSCPTT